MAIVTLPNIGNGSDPATINVSVLNGKVDPLATDYNGNIQNVNIAAAAGIVYSKLTLTDSVVNADINSAAAIVDTKLDQITTAGKVSGAAITALASTPSGAGALPVANGGNGIIIMPTFSAHKNGTDQTGIADSTLTKVTFGTEDWDVNSNFASSTFTPTVAGKYLITACVQWNSIGDGFTGQANVYFNGSNLRTLYANRAGAAGNQLCSGTVLVVMNGSTDYIEIFAQHSDTGGTRDIEGDATQTYFQGCWVTP